MSVKKLGKLTEAKFAQKTTGPVGVVGSAPSADEMRWKAEEAMRTIHRAAEHQKDKPLMREVKKLIKSHAKACGMK